MHIHNLNRCGGLSRPALVHALHTPVGQSHSCACLGHAPHTSVGQSHSCAWPGPCPSHVCLDHAPRPTRVCPGLAQVSHLPLRVLAMPPCLRIATVEAHTKLVLLTLKRDTFTEILGPLEQLMAR